MDLISSQLIDLEHPDYRVRRDACRQLGLQTNLPEQAIVALERALRDPEPRVADAARHALQMHRDRPGDPKSSGSTPPDPLEFPARPRTSGVNMWLWLLLIVGVLMLLAIMGSGGWRIALEFSPFVVAGIIILKVLDALRRRKMMEAWGELASQTGLQLKPGHPEGILRASSAPGLSGIYRGRRVSFSGIQGNRFGFEMKGALTHTSIRLHLSNPAACRLHIYPTGLLARVFRPGRIASGDPDFDRRFHFEGSPQNFLHRALQLLPRYPILLGRPDGVVMAAAGQPLAGTRGLPSIYLEGSLLECVQPGVPGNAYAEISVLNFLSELADLAELEAADHPLSRRLPAQPPSAVPAPVRPATRTAAPRISLPTILLILFSLMFALITELPELFQPGEPPGDVSPVSMPGAVSAQETQIVSMRSTDVARFVTTATAQVTARAAARGTDIALARSTNTAIAAATDQSGKMYVATVEASMQKPEGPYTGSLKHVSPDGLVELRYLSRKLQNFVAQATFLNPYSASDTGPWAYGFIFRDDSAQMQHYRLILKSSKQWGKQWELQFVTYSDRTAFRTVASGRLPKLNTDKDGSNKVWLLARDDKGILFVNGAYVADLDLSAHQGAGLIAVATGMEQGTEINGYSTGYEDFTVWQIP